MGVPHPLTFVYRVPIWPEAIAIVTRAAELGAAVVVVVAVPLRAYVLRLRGSTLLPAVIYLSHREPGLTRHVLVVVDGYQVSDAMALIPIAIVGLMSVKTRTQ
jgi:hypothetical protein